MLDELCSLMAADELGDTDHGQLQVETEARPTP